MKSALVACCLLLLASCTTSVPRDAEPHTASPPPWSGGSITRGAARNVTLQEWAKASNRATCAALGFSSLGEGEGATPRPANFSGGWAVAYDKPGGPGVEPTGVFCAECGRGTFGIAGAGVEAGDGGSPEGGRIIEWSDGSHASIFLQGGSGPGHLAYMEVEGERCLYNVWSYLGEEHLAYLLGTLRYVQ